MAKRTPPGWLVDYRFWVILFIVGFWPAVMLGTYLGLAILLLVVVGGTIVTQRLDRRARDAPTAFAANPPQEGANPSNAGR